MPLTSSEMPLTSLSRDVSVKTHLLGHAMEALAHVMFEHSSDRPNEHLVWTVQAVMT
jgi:hypothetical protein